tara:strand:- start:4296 stop:5240 length:945 start_codon:yes stop_codon:yes gene_type:complete
MISAARSRAVKDFNKSVAAKVLMPIKGKVSKGVEIGHEMVDDVHTQVSKAYRKALEKVPDIKVDQKFADSVKSLSDDVSYLPPDRAAQYKKFVADKVLGKMKGGRMDGRTMKDIDSDLGEWAERYRRSTDGDQAKLGDAFFELQSAIRDLTLRSAPKGAKELRAADKSWALLKRYQNAAAKQAADDGVFTPKQYKAAVRAMDRSKDKSKFARGKALDQKTATDATDVLSNTLPNSGTADRGLAAALAGGGYMIDPVVGIGALGAMAPYTRLGQKAAAAALTKRPGAVRSLGQGIQYVSPVGSAVVPQGLLNTNQ